MPISVGTRRKSSSDLMKNDAPDGTGMQSLTLSDGGGSKQQQQRANLPRKGSARNVKIAHKHADSEGSVVGNFMQNIHSSPLQATMHYEAPIYPKSEKDAEFISVSLQRNFVFANALSDEDVSRKRERSESVV